MDLTGLTVPGDVSVSVQVLGDVVCAVFGDEEEAVLFIPNAGDSMICAGKDWLDLTVGNFSVSTSDVAQNQDAHMNLSSGSVSDLRSALVHFGADLV